MERPNIRFTQNLIQEPEDQQQVAFNLSVRDLPTMLRQSFQLNGITKCPCGRVTHIELTATPAGPKSKAEWCCVDFERIASKYIPFAQ